MDFNDDELELAIRDIIVDICEVMYKRGYDAVPIGAMMRLVGVEESRAQKHDNEYLALDADFQNILKTRKSPPLSKAPDGVTLH